MVYALNILLQCPQFWPVVHVTAGEEHFFIQSLGVTSGQVINCAPFVAYRGKSICQGAAQKACSTGYQESQVMPSLYS